MKTNNFFIKKHRMHLLYTINLVGPAKVIGTNRAKIFSDGSPARGRLAQPLSSAASRAELEMVREYVRARQVPGERVPPLGAEQDSLTDTILERFVIIHSFSTSPFIFLY